MKWENAINLPGAPLVLGSLSAAGAILDWDGILVFSLLAAYLMNWQPGISPELGILVLAPFVAWGARFLRFRANSFDVRRMSKEAIAALAAGGAVFLIVVADQLSIAAPSSLRMHFPYLIAAIAVAAVWGFFDAYIAEHLL